MAKELKIGIIGAGGIAQYAHIPGFQKIAGVEVVALSDPNLDKLKTVAEKFAIPKTFSDYRKLIKEKEIDVISICSPNYLHKEQAVVALVSGKDVFCEKPVSMNSAEAKEILNTASKTGRKFMVAFPHRFSASASFLKGLIDNGKFGRIYYAKASCLRRRGIPGLGGWFTTKELSGGGPLIDIGVHILDKTYWLMGSPEPVSVTGVTFQKFKKLARDGGWPPLESRIGDKYGTTFDVEDMAAAFIRFENGAVLFLESSWAGNSENALSYSLFGEKSGAREDEAGLKIFGEQSGILTDTVANLISVNTYDEEIKHFVACIREDFPPITTPDQILAVSKMIEGIYQSASTGKEIKF